ncbi:MAG: helix-turn-helix domain-containing protein [Deltaproteobacteria bacterium]|nr:helix-turn-helix domain-containing protein [Deltaproteobacteria bacterium]
MSKPEPPTDSPLTALEGWFRGLIREELQAAKQNGEQGGDHLLTPEELADRLQVPRSWVYEQSRQENIPTHRLGRYIRFNLHEVLASQKKD